MAYHILPKLKPRTKSHARSPHQFFKPASPTTASAMASFLKPKPATQPLPCGCSRPHMLVPKLDTIVESPLNDKFAPSSPRRPDTTDRVVLTPKFHYYIPQMSTSQEDLYTSKMPRVYVPTTAATFLNSPVSEDDDLELPYIREDDFPYYPRLVERDGEADDRVTEKSLTGCTLKRGKLVMKMSGEEYWLEKRVVGVLRKLKIGNRKA
ncbi:hypothetical protein BDV95DRAFT_587013 [Massariosphaeria phaeospora]|uniref:Uncharacterized protein n=1 Tax=Massariosphaeria phaeospora TaxID=100035 RepID=A0A7C8M026_9PLEO|nr:hypothetical protein BDV95DRAFT_587013 [Massariosphaeria phaeospora]